MKKIKLSIYERLWFPSLSLQNGDKKDMLAVRIIEDKIKIAPKEQEEIELVQLPNGSTKWNGIKAKDKEFTFEDIEIMYIQAGLAQADSQKRLNKDNLDLFLRLEKWASQTEEKLTKK